MTVHLWANFKLPATGFSKQADEDDKLDQRTVRQRQMRKREEKRRGEREREEAKPFACI